MRPRLVLPLTTMLLLSLILSGFAIQAPIATGSGAQQAVSLSESPSLLAPQGKQKRKRAGRAERKRQRGHHQQPTRQGAQGPGRGRVGLWTNRCNARGLIRLPEAEACTHGPDPAPPGVDIARSAPPIPARVASQQAATIACNGNGQSGFRVQVLYVRGSDVASRFGTYLASFRGWAAEADQIFQDSAAETGGSRALRFVHDGNCLPIVQEVVLSPAGDGNFGTTITELEDLGYNRSDRFYLLFVDTTSAGICGIGTLWGDDRHSGDDNWNNTGPGWARADAGCWDGWVAAHELMHNLGGVQNSSPNTSLGYHCVDEYDVMCYSDDPHYPDMRFDCPVAALDETRFDCNHDDYYHTNPASGSYLANFWNPANNQFLIGARVDPPPPPPPDTTRPEWSISGPSTHRAGRRMTLKVEATDVSLIARVELYRCKPGCRRVAQDATAPYRFHLRHNQPGRVRYKVRVFDRAGNFTEKFRVIVVRTAPRR